MGTPQTRWREMHQSVALGDHGLIMRSLPHRASSARSSQAFTAASLMASTEQNHCGVARKMMGFLQRQQWG